MAPVFTELPPETIVDVARDPAVAELLLDSLALLEDLTHAVVPELEGRVEVGFQNLLRGPFEHDQFLLVPDINEVEITLRHLRVRGIGEELAVDAANPNRPEGPCPRNITDHQRRRRADDAQDIRIVLGVGAEEDALHLNFVVPPLREERPDRPVNHPAGEDFLFRRTALALEIAARELARRGGFLTVVDRQREEILTRFGRRGGHGRDDDDGFT